MLPKLILKKNRFVEWVNTPIHYRPYQLGYYKLPLLALLIDIVITTLTILLYVETEVDVEELDMGLEILSLSFIPLLFLLAGIEEMIFRILPLTWAMRNVSKQNIVLAALFTAIAFGFVHGGLANIPLQGLGGLVYAIVFIKYAHGERYMEAGFVVITIHTVFNGLIALLSLSEGVTTF